MRFFTGFIVAAFATCTYAAPVLEHHALSGTYKVIACTPDCENSYAGNTPLSDVDQLRFNIQVGLDLISCNSDPAFDMNVYGGFGAYYYNNYSADQICDGKWSEAAARVSFTSPSGIALDLRKTSGDHYTFRWLDQRFVNPTDATLTLERVDK